MAKSPHPLALSLRNLASKIERNLLAPSEALALATLLRRIAAGESFDEILGVKRAASRPRKNTPAYYVEQVYWRTQPTFDGKPGVTVTSAIDAVAKACHVSVDTVSAAFYSPAGRAYLAEIEAALKNPLV